MSIKGVGGGVKTQKSGIPTNLQTRHTGGQYGAGENGFMEYHDCNSELENKNVLHVGQYPPPPCFALFVFMFVCLSLGGMGRIKKGQRIWDMR